MDEKATGINIEIDDQAFESLFDFLDGLQASGYEIGARQYSALNDLLMVLIAQGEIFDDFANLKTFIAPLICSTPAEQQDFYKQFDQWIASQVRRKRLLQGEKSTFDSQEKLSKQIDPTIFVGWLIPVLATIVILNFFLVPANRELVWNLSTNLIEFLSKPFIVLIGFASVILTAFLIWWLRKENQFITRQPTKQKPVYSNIPLKADDLHDLLPVANFKPIVRGLRKRMQISSTEVDVEKTIERALTHNNWLEIVYRQRQLIPEYLVLIDRKSRVDQQARFVQEVLQRLVADGVWLHQYEFNGDPRICFPFDQKDRTLRLSDLQSLYPEARLLVFSSSNELANPMTGQLQGWFEPLTHWDERAIFTATKIHEILQEELQTLDFAILPMTLDGLTELAQVFEHSSSKLISEDILPLPTQLVQRPARWTARNAPSVEEVIDLISTLRNYLGESGFYWLCACAVYPELNWKLTIILGNKLNDKNNQPLLNANTFLRLASLPWLRAGYMPDWFRLVLIESFVDTQEADTRAVVKHLLENAFEGQDAELQIGSSKNLDEQNQLEDGVLSDEIFMRFVLAQSQKKLAVKAPVAIQQYVKNNPVKPALPPETEPINTPEQEADPIQKSKQIEEAIDDESTIDSATTTTQIDEVIEPIQEVAPTVVETVEKIEETSHPQNNIETTQEVEPAQKPIEPPKTLNRNTASAKQKTIKVDSQGLSRSKLPELTAASTISLTEPEKELIASLYLNYEKIILEKEFYSFSNARLFLLVPIKANGAMVSRMITKIGAASELEQEKYIYDYYAARPLPFTTPQLRNYHQIGDSAGLNYIFPGDSLGKITTLEDYYFAQPVERINGILNELLDMTMGAAWYGQSQPYHCLFRDEYGRHLIPHDQMRETVSNVFPRISLLDEKRIQVPGVGGTYPDPLALYPILLDQTLAGRRSTVHGDLHLRNILVDETDKGWLIDFSKVKERHNLFDFIKLETYIRLLALAQVAGAFSLGEYMQFEQALNASTLNLASTPPTNPELAKAYQVILNIRQIARKYIVVSSGFINEYLPSLFLYTLSMLKYFSANGPVATQMMYLTSCALATAILGPTDALEREKPKESDKMQNLKKNNKGGISIRGNATGNVIINGDQNKVSLTNKNIKTEGGTYINGNVSVTNGDFVGRDKISNSNSVSADELAKAFTLIIEKANQENDSNSKEEALFAMEKLITEANRGEQAEESRVRRWLTFLAEASPDTWEVAVSLLSTPLIGLPTAFRKEIQRQIETVKIRKSVKVFINHANEDKPLVRKLNLELKKYSWIDPWLDEEKLLAGQNWSFEIGKAMEEADAVLVCISENSVRKPGYVQSEIRKAQEQQKLRPPGSIYLIPVLLEPCQIPDSLQQFQWVDVSQHNAIKRIVKSLETLRN